MPTSPADGASRDLEGEAPPEPPRHGSGGASPSNFDPVRRSRSRPHHEVLSSEGRPTIVFLTVCTEGRSRWLASDENHRMLVEAWHAATAWVVGRYVIMPDHLHLFAAPGKPELPLANWVRFWKAGVRRSHGRRLWRFQADYWDTTLRSGDAYDSKWDYVRRSPVRHAIVPRAEDWPFQGELNSLRWE